MKSLKTSHLLILIVVILISCKRNLDQSPIGLVDESKLANKSGVEGLLISAYSLLDGVGLVNQGSNYVDWQSAGSNWIYGSICGSEAHKGSELINPDQEEILQLEKFQATAQTAYLQGKWSAVYEGVQRANTVLRILAKAKDINENDRKRITAEARFLRGFYHFEAIKMWNKVPYVDETITYEAGNYHLPNDTLIWPAIENDFRFAMNILPAIMNAPGRANKYAAEAFLAKAMMFQGKKNQNEYVEAKPLLEDLINNGTTATGIKYALLQHFHDNFDAATKNSAESVFAAQSSVNDGAFGQNGNIGDILNFPFGGGAPGQCCGFFQPSQYLVNHFKTVSGLPDLDNYNTPPDVKNDQGIPSSDPFTPYDGPLDPRLDWTIGRRGIPYLDWGDHPGKDWIREPTQGYGPYAPLKNVFPKSQQDRLTDATFWGTGGFGSTAINVNLIRFADILLWATEVEIEIGSLDKARDYINRIRARAKDPSGWVKKSSGPFAPYAANYQIELYPSNYFMSKESALKALRYERMLEFGMEGHRFFDLVRWGIAAQEINSYLAVEKQKRTYLNGVQFKASIHEYFPIPQRQIDLSAGVDGIPKMKQNPGY